MNQRAQKKHLLFQQLSDRPVNVTFALLHRGVPVDHTSLVLFSTNCSSPLCVARRQKKGNRKKTMSRWSILLVAAAAATARADISASRTIHSVASGYSVRLDIADGTSGGATRRRSNWL